MTPQPEKNSLYTFPRIVDNNMTVDIQSAHLSNHHPHHNHHQDTELPTPPLSSSHTSTTGPTFFPAGYSLSNNSFSTLERCEALESELSDLRSKLHRSEQSSVVREKRLSQAQQHSSNTQQSLQTLKQQHEMTLIQLSKTQGEANSSRIRLEERETENQQLKTQVKSLASELREVTLDRDSLSMEMVECHADNSKFLKRLRVSNDKVDRLQDENRYLIEQLRELRSRMADLSEKRVVLSETLDHERQQTVKLRIEHEEAFIKHKKENEELKGLVAALEKNQIQNSIDALQTIENQQPQHQQQQQQSEQLDDVSQTCELHEYVSKSSATPPLSFTDTAPPLNSSDILNQQEQHHPESFDAGESTLTSIISSISSVASGGHFRRSKSIRQSRIVPSGVMIDI
ncbi:hypothetical protein BGZ76_006430 [Entomortierella beljakovae]|nr:hypothetical protein BGZ76_006430 [Entomortierella beljakovae]